MGEGGRRRIGGDRIGEGRGVHRIHTGEGEGGGERIGEG